MATDGARWPYSEVSDVPAKVAGVVKVNDDEEGVEKRGTL